MKRRVMWAVALFVILGGPTPGSVGSCSDDTKVSSPEKFCLDSEALQCQRDHARDRIDDDEYDACLDAVGPMCDGFAWNPSVCDPPPSTQRTRACLSALASEERLDTATEDLVECKAKVLCGGD